ncbi:hypothetical protein PR202_ga19409 [Eleusine coracana subsp. coracana]|uniref:DUF4378 domain-containing protein n=1 Tax=Eleusine coracana subsp. coracana TaxID=191504 RepID=A0AAV5CVH9_ELECO|nr:hypothetical protein PR202_ga19409 [Eleusine coracana subsp. coracana]
MFSSAMAKKSYKQHCKSEKVQVGCMSGLMRMLDFRRHPKLISDGRGSAKLECEGYDGETELQGMTCSLDQSVTSPKLERRLRLAVSDNVKDNQLNSMSSIFHKAEADPSKQLPVAKVNTMHDIVENLPLCAEIETLGERVEGSQDQCSSEEPQSMNVLPEVPLCSPDDPIDEQENHSLSEVVQSVKPSVLSCLCSLENTNDREEKLSPQSVLDSVVGDITSPTHKSRKQDELSKPTPRVLFKELDTTSASPALWNVPQVDILDDKGARVSFIKVVLEASGLLSEEISQRWYTEESLLHVSVLAEVGNLYCLTDDAVLLFDCVEEVLLKIRDNFFGVGPWFAFLKYNVRPTPVGRNLVHEVTKSIDAIVSNELPNTLDQVIMKDLEIESWMDLRHDAEGVAIELWDGLFDDLLEEMVFDLWL